ncbi:hypothetical protein D030_4765A, partial [Vibrio parahaemolyticus AQ3810]|jgi:hypothetical protein
MELSR